MTMNTPRFVMILCFIIDCMLVTAALITLTSGHIAWLTLAVITFLGNNVFMYLYARLTDEEMNYIESCDS